MNEVLFSRVTSNSPRAASTRFSHWDNESAMCIAAKASRSAALANMPMKFCLALGLRSHRKTWRVN